MPYIKKEDRKIYDSDIESLIEKLNAYNDPLMPFRIPSGDVVYILYKLLTKVYGFKNSNFEIKHKALGILESAKLEYYRKVMAPYENQKEKENGEIIS